MIEPCKITEIRTSLINAGFYNPVDIEEICNLEREYMETCAEIAEECEVEGYPANGDNYELRCAEARKYVDEQIELIDAKYPLPEDN